MKLFPEIASRRIAMGRGHRAGQVLYWTLLIGGCVVFMLMNFYTTIKEDDMFHSTIGGGSTRPINNLIDVLRSWVAYYQYDARLANVISFTFNGLLPKCVFNVFNTLVFGLMAHLLSLLATRRCSAMVPVVLLTYMVTAMPVPGETLLWETGSFNYLWNVTASMLFVAYLLWHRETNPGWARCVAVLLLSSFAGGINEGTTFGVFGGLVLYYLLNRGKVDRAVLVGMTGYLLGIVLLLTCPGAWERASGEVSRDMGAMALLLSRSRLIMVKSLTYVTPAAALLILPVAWVKHGFKKTFASSPWPLVFLVLLAFAFVVGKEQPRLYFAVTMAGLVIVLMAIDAVAARWQWLPVAVTVAGLAICACYYPSNIDTMRRYQVFFNGVEHEITSCEGRQVVIEEPVFHGYSRFIKPFNLNSWNFLIREETLCRYYGKENIQFIPSQLWLRCDGRPRLRHPQYMPFTAPACPDIDTVYAVPQDDFMAVVVARDTITHSYQFAHAFKADGTPLLPVPYFPLFDGARELLIFPLVGDEVDKLTFSPFALDGEYIDLIRTGPNPEWDYDIDKDPDSLWNDIY